MEGSNRSRKQVVMRDETEREDRTSQKTQKFTKLVPAWVPVDLLVSLQGSPGAKVENGGFECWTSFSVERAQLPV